MNALTRQKRVRTQLMSDGKRVNWPAISFFFIEEIQKEENQGYTFFIKWKYKASIKTIETCWTGKEIRIDEHFRKINIVRFKDNIFINLERLQIVEERPIHGPLEKTEVIFYFEDGLRLVERLPATKWAWWKNTFM